MKKKTKVFLTKHSNIRFDERTDYNKEIRADLAVKAFKYGHEFSEFNDPLATFLNSLGYGSSGKYVAKIYENYVYIFNNCCGHRLLTVYAVPEEYLPIDKYLIQNSDLGRCMISLTNKKNGQRFYWHEFGGLTEDIGEALEFTSQIKAKNYLNNNYEIDSYKDSYDIELF